MRLSACEIEGYRSLRDCMVPLGNVTVLVGDNAVGKTSIVRALALVQAASQGTICRRIAEEGGLGSVAWAGRHTQDAPGADRVRLSIRLDALIYSIEIGAPKSGELALANEPAVREERLAHVVQGPQGTVEKTVMHREGATVRLLDAHGKRQLYAQHLLPSETALFAFRDAARYPELALLRQLLDDWRIYHRFSLEAGAPARRPSLALCAPALAPRGEDLPAALATILQVKGQPDLVQDPLREAFPDAEIAVAIEDGLARFTLKLPDMERPLAAHELSEGMLQYVCLVAALSSYRPPGIIALNEPESGLQRDLLAPLARLVARAAKDSQIIVVTHSRELVEELEKAAAARVVEVSKADGVTSLHERGASMDERDPPSPFEQIASHDSHTTQPSFPEHDHSPESPMPPPIPVAAALPEPPSPQTALPSTATPGGPTAVAEMAAQREEMRRLESARATLQEIRAMLSDVRHDPEIWPRLYPQLQDRLRLLRAASDILPAEMNALTATLESEIQTLAPPA